MKQLLKKSALLCTLLAGSGLPFASVSAAPMQGPQDISFYTPPVMAGGMQGELIWYRPATVQLGDGAAAVQAWNVLYRSTDARGNANLVTGTVIVPTAAWSGGGDRPLIGYAVGTHGLAQQCAPSMQLAAGKDYESANIAAAIGAGYAVLVSDNPGYTTGATPTYLAGRAQAHANLDLFRAAAQIPGAGINGNAKAALWGYSQGGQTAAWVGEIKSSYAPELNLVGIAAGGTPADFPRTARYLEASTGASFLLGAVIGLGEQYPEDIPLDELANADGQAAIATGKSQCVFESLFTFMNDSISEYTVGNQTLDEVIAIPSVNQTLMAQNLGSKKIPVPIYQYHGKADEFIPIDQHVELKRDYCRKFSNVTFAVYPSEHIVTQFQAAPHVLSWLGDRFAGKATYGTCLTFKPAPTSTANPGGGNFVVSLDEWPLDARIELNTLAQTVQLPSTATFSADTDITDQSLTGSLSVPGFTSSLKIIGIPLDIRLQVDAVGPTTGTVSLDNEGQLSINGLSRADITVRSAGFSFLQIPFGCKTSSPVDFPINFSGPVSSLGNGNLTFSGTTSFPALSGCGLFNSLFTTLMSGPGQQYMFNVSPPAPTSW
ncbi:MAG: Triacylglycerol lipase [Alcanivoracaceae bacterium]|nr:Triacylglycerol lipase [Alcanivoracaceae bacterium]